MKKLIVFMFVLSRFLDLVSTFYASGSNMVGETSPLVAYFKFGWISFIVINMVATLLIIYLFYRFSDRRLKNKEDKYTESIEHFLSYISYVFCDKKVKLLILLTTSRIDFNIFLHCLFYSLPIAFSFASIPIILNNIIVTKHPTFITHLSPFLASLLVVSSLILIMLMVSLIYLYNRFKKIKDD